MQLSWNWRKLQGLVFNMIKPEQYINFSGQDWTALKLYLEQAREKKIGLLIQADSHDKSNQVRGALQLIQELLALEKAAKQAAN